MAGFSKLFVVGGLGGFQGSDGVNPIAYQILVGDASKCWLEPHYFDTSIRPMGNIRLVIPRSAGDDVLLDGTLLDAVLAFSPSFFTGCPSLAAVQAKLKDAEQLDFAADTDQIPAEWQSLREEARANYSKLHIWKAELQAVRLE